MIWALLLVGCYPEARYTDDLDEAICAWKATCYGDDEVACVEAAVDARTDVAEGCEYDRAAAHDCTRGLRDLECPGDTGGDFGFPAACDEVYTCP